jgi:type 1 fimbria pilin
MRYSINFFYSFEMMINFSKSIVAICRPSIRRGYNKGRISAQVQTILCAALLALCSVQAWAESVVFPSSGSYRDIKFSQSLSPSANMPVGGQIAAWYTLYGLAHEGITCPVIQNVTGNGTLVPGQTQIYKTNVPGVGVRFSVGVGWDGSYSPDAPYTKTLDPPEGDGSADIYIIATLVATGPIGSGTLTSLPSVTITFTGTCIAPVTFTQKIAPGSSVTVQSCTVTTSAPAITLDPVNANKLTGVGSTAGGVDVPLKLSCPTSGMKLFMTLTDSADPANRSTTLTLKSGSTASGVALQVLNPAGTPVAFGADSSKAGNTNQFSVGTSTAGEKIIPLKARYIQTAPKINPGTVNAVATFTMSYQ